MRRAENSSGDQPDMPGRHAEGLSRRLRALLGGCAIVGSLAGALVIAELSANSMEHVPEAKPIEPRELGLPAELVEADAVLGRSFRPNAQKFFVSPYGEFAVNYQINEIGLRESGMIALGEPPQHVAVLGDAFAEGWGVMPEATFIREIERRLRLQSEPSYNVRFLNAGMSGYGAAQSYLLARRLMQTVKLDVVVLVYTSLMPVADHHFLAHADLDADGLAVRAGAKSARTTRPEVAPDSWLRRSALFRLGQAVLDTWWARDHLLPGEPASDWFAAARDDQPALAELHRPSLAHVAALARLAESKGAKFMLVHIPLPHQVAADEWPEGRRAYQFPARDYAAPDIDLVESFCAEQALHCVMTAPMLREVSAHTASRVYFRYDHTLTNVGHRALVSHLLGTIAAALRPSDDA